MTDCYCHKCKKITATNDVAKSGDKRHMIKGKCAVCERNKTSFVAKLNDLGERIHPVKEPKTPKTPKTPKKARVPKVILEEEEEGDEITILPAKRKRVTRSIKKEEEGEIPPPLEI